MDNNYNYFVHLLNQSLNLNNNESNLISNFLLNKTEYTIKRHALIYLCDNPNHYKDYNFIMIQLILLNLYNNKNMDLVSINNMIDNMILHGRKDANKLYDILKFNTN